MSTLKNTLFNTIFLSLLCCYSMLVLAAQDIYQYEDKEGVTEFTDRLKPDKTPKQHIQIENTPARQIVEGQDRLDKLIQYNEEYDNNIAEQQRLENERREKQQELNAQRSNDQINETDNNRYDYNGGYYGSRPGRPGYRPKPVNPIERPKPVKPKPISEIIKPNPSHPFTPVRSGR